MHKVRSADEHITYSHNDVTRGMCCVMYSTQCHQLTYITSGHIAQWLVLQRVEREAHVVHVLVELATVVDTLLHVTRQVGHHHGTLRLRTRWLKRAARQHALEPTLPVLEYLLPKAEILTL